MTRFTTSFFSFFMVTALGCSSSSTPGNPSGGDGGSDDVDPIPDTGPIDPTDPASCAVNCDPVTGMYDPAKPNCMFACNDSLSCATYVGGKDKHLGGMMRFQSRDGKCILTLGSSEYTFSQTLDPTKYCLGSWLNGYWNASVFTSPTRYEQISFTFVLEDKEYRCFHPPK